MASGARSSSSIASRRREHQQLDAPSFGLLGDILDDGQRPGGSAADHEALTVPRDVLAQGKGRVPISRPEGLGRSLLALPEIPAIDHEIVVVGRTVDLDRPEAERSESHERQCRGSGASRVPRLRLLSLLLRGDALGPLGSTHRGANSDLARCRGSRDGEPDQHDLHSGCGRWVGSSVRGSVESRPRDIGLLPPGALRRRRRPSVGDHEVARRRDRPLAPEGCRVRAARRRDVGPAADLRAIRDRGLRYAGADRTDTSPRRRRSLSVRQESDVPRGARDRSSARRSCSGDRSCLGYAALVALAFIAFVRGYEEPTLLQAFGEEYEEYRRAVPGWWPRLHPWKPH